MPLVVHHDVRLAHVRGVLPDGHLVVHVERFAPQVLAGPAHLDRQEVVEVIQSANVAELVESRRLEPLVIVGAELPGKRRVEHDVALVEPSAEEAAPADGPGESARVRKAVLAVEAGLAEEPDSVVAVVRAEAELGARADAERMRVVRGVDLVPLGHLELGVVAPGVGTHDIVHHDVVAIRPEVVDDKTHCDDRVQYDAENDESRDASGSCIQFHRTIPCAEETA